MHHKLTDTWKVLYANQPTPDQSHVELQDNSKYDTNFICQIDVASWLM